MRVCNVTFVQHARAKRHLRPKLGFFQFEAGTGAAIVGAALGRFSGANQAGWRVRLGTAKTSEASRRDEGRLTPLVRRSLWRRTLSKVFSDSQLSLTGGQQMTLMKSLLLGSAATLVGRRRRAGRRSSHEEGRARCRICQGLQDRQHRRLHRPGHRHLPEDQRLRHRPLMRSARPTTPMRSAAAVSRRSRALGSRTPTAPDARSPHDRRRVEHRLRPVGRPYGHGRRVLGRLCLRQYLCDGWSRWPRQRRLPSRQGVADLGRPHRR